MWNQLKISSLILYVPLELNLTKSSFYSVENTDSMQTPAIVRKVHMEFFGFWMQFTLVMPDVDIAFQPTSGGLTSGMHNTPPCQWGKVRIRIISC
jgi:hypothetical protein